MTLGFLSGSKNFCELLCVSWEVFVLHGYDWIHWVAKSCTTIASMIVSRFTTFTENFVIWCYPVTKKFSTRYGSAIASSARSPGTFGPLTDLAISVFREVSINTAFTQIHTSSRCRFWRWFMRRTGVCVCLCVQELYHPRDFLWILAAIPVCQNTTGRPVLNRGLRFYLVLDFWLAWSTGRSVLSVQHVILTQMLDGNLSHSDLPVLESLTVA